MAHPQAREYVKFYEHYEPKPSRCISPDRMARPATAEPFAKRTIGNGDIGYAAQLYGRQEFSSMLTPDKRHHKTWSPLGIRGAHNQRLNIFTELPGSTFNTQTWDRFATTAAKLRQGSRPYSSPVKSRRAP